LKATIFQKETKTDAEVCPHRAHTNNGLVAFLNMRQEWEEIKEHTVENSVYRAAPTPMQQGFQRKEF